MKLFHRFDGRPILTGLHMPLVRPTDGIAYADANQLKTLDEIRDIAKDSKRTPRREIFDAKTWIRRQIDSGCNGFGTAAALGRTRVMRGFNPVVLSGDFIYAQINGGRDAGSGLSDGMKAVQTIGICPDSMVPIGTWRKNKIKAECYEAAKQFVGFEAYRVDSEMELYDGLASGFVGVVAIQVGRRWESFSSTGVLTGDSGGGNHAVCVQDLRVNAKGEIELDMVNSHGIDYGQDGHAWITYPRHLAQPSRNHAFWLLRSTIDGSNDAVAPDIAA